MCWFKLFKSCFCRLSLVLDYLLLMVFIMILMCLSCLCLRIWWCWKSGCVRLLRKVSCLIGGFMNLLNRFVLSWLMSFISWNLLMINWVMLRLWRLVVMSLLFMIILIFVFVSVFGVICVVDCIF